MTGALTVSADDRPANTFTFSLQPGGTGSAMQEYQALVAKMADPAAFVKMSEKERAAFEKKMEDVGDRMTKEMEAMTANPAAMMEKQAQFGCGCDHADHRRHAGLRQRVVRAEGRLADAQGRTQITEVRPPRESRQLGTLSLPLA